MSRFKWAYWSVLEELNNVIDTVAIKKLQFYYLERRLLEATTFSTLSKQRCLKNVPNIHVGKWAWKSLKIKSKYQMTCCWLVRCLIVFSKVSCSTVFFWTSPVSFERTSSKLAIISGLGSSFNVFHIAFKAYDQRVPGLFFVGILFNVRFSGIWFILFNLLDSNAFVPKY